MPPRPGVNKAALPQWVQPQLTKLADAAPEGSEWLHEIKFDGYRMHARLDCGRGDIAERAYVKTRLPIIMAQFPVVY